MSTARRLNYTYDEYLKTLELSPLKLEFWGGEILAMAGGTPEHNALATQLAIMLGARLPKGCRVFTAEAKIRSVAADVSVFPDVSVVCGRVERASDDKNAISNPGLVVEVLSPSTEEFDRGAKLKHYQAMKSVSAVWLVSNPKARITLFERHLKGWKATERGAGEQLTLAAPALTIDVDELYAVLDGF